MMTGLTVAIAVTDFELAGANFFGNQLDVELGRQLRCIQRVGHASHLVVLFDEHVLGLHRSRVVSFCAGRSP